MRIVLISGSGFYRFPEFLDARSLSLETPFGEVELCRGLWGEHELIFLSRHGENHHYLSHQINHQANLAACQALEVDAVLGFSIVGVVNPSIPLGQLLLPAELFFPDNRLSDGSPCTMFQIAGQPGRGHLIAERHFHQGLGGQIRAAALKLELPIVTDLVYGQVQGPRFNSRPEIQQLASVGVDVISQTLGPESVLAGELELPYAGLCFGVDYANGVQPEPTPIATLQANMKASRTQFLQVTEQLLQDFQQVIFEGFVYRFD